MPLFGKKDSNKKTKKDGKDDKSPSVEDKYVLKELLGTYVLYVVAECVLESCSLKFLNARSPYRVLNVKESTKRILLETTRLIVDYWHMLIIYRFLFLSFLSFVLMLFSFCFNSCHMYREIMNAFN